jgi:hypothetical protein
MMKVLFQLTDCDLSAFRCFVGRLARLADPGIEAAFPVAVEGRAALELIHEYRCGAQEGRRLRHLAASVTLITKFATAICAAG